MREPGFYWVKMNQQWMPACLYESGFWGTLDFDLDVADEEEFDEIGSRIHPPGTPITIATVPDMRARLLAAAGLEPSPTRESLVWLSPELFLQDVTPASRRRLYEYLHLEFTRQD